MFTFDVTTNGTTRTFNSSGFELVSVKGINPPKATLNMTKLAGINLSVMNSVNLPNRNIVVKMKIGGSADANRQTLNTAFPIGSAVIVHYKNKSVDVKIVGYVDSVDYDVHSKIEWGQVSLICPNPYFEDSNYTNATITPGTGVVDVAFPNYSNQCDSGFELTAEVSSGNKFYISKSTLGDCLEVDYTFEALDEVTVITRRGECSVKVKRSGVTTDITHLSNFVFPTVDSATKAFKVVCGSPAPTVTAKIKYQYLGI